MGLNHQEAELMIDDCIERQSKLSEWEENFIHSINGKHNGLSDKQLSILNTIWEKATRGF